MAAVDMDDVVEFGDRPIGAVLAFGTIVNGILATNASQIVLGDVAEVERRVAHIDGAQGNSFSLGQGNCRHGILSSETIH